MATTIKLDALAAAANPHRAKIAAAMRAGHHVANISGDPVIVAAMDGIHAAVGAADVEIVGLMNVDGTARARPEDGGDGGNKNQN